MTTAVRFYGFQDTNMHNWWIWIGTMWGICVTFNIWYCTELVESITMIGQPMFENVVWLRWWSIHHQIQPNLAIWKIWKAHFETCLYFFWLSTWTICGNVMMFKYFFNSIFKTFLFSKNHWICTNIFLNFCNIVKHCTQVTFFFFGATS